MRGSLYVNPLRSLNACRGDVRASSFQILARHSGKIQVTSKRLSECFHMRSPLASVALQLLKNLIGIIGTAFKKGIKNNCRSNQGPICACKSTCMR